MLIVEQLLPAPNLLSCQVFAAGKMGNESFFRESKRGTKNTAECGRKVGDAIKKFASIIYNTSRNHCPPTNFKQS